MPLLKIKKSLLCKPEEHADATTYAACLSNVRREPTTHERVLAAVLGEDVGALADILAKYLTGGPATVSPLRLAAFLLGD